VINETEAGQLFQGEVDALEMAERDRLGFDGKLLPEVRTVAHGVKALEKNFFGPGTLGRTWGTRPETLERISLRRCFMAASVGREEETPKRLVPSIII
jgi:hypothetical protein